MRCCRDNEWLEKKARQIRRETLEMCGHVGAGHVTSGFSCTELLVALYHGGILRCDPQNPDWSGRDYFVLSKGHSSTALYPVLADMGFFPKEELQRCCDPNAMLGLLLKKDVPGVEISSGSLGIGLGVAAGIALGLKMDRASNMVFCMLGDGECHEGNIWESAMFANQYRLNNLVAIVDRNYLCCTDFTENIMQLEPFSSKWEAFGWEVKHINGHRFDQIFDALDNVHAMKRAKPLVIIADTVKGKGIDFISNVPLMHGVALCGEKLDEGRRCLETTEENP